MSSIILSARPEFSKVALGKKHEIHLLVTLEGMKLEGKRKPLALGIAVDCSGSMSGDKLIYAKKSLQKLVEHLTEEDVLGVVGFSDNVWTVLEPARMTPEAKDRARTEIAKLGLLSMTNLSGATIEAYNSLRAAAEKKVKDSVDRAFLFTDGLPTVGVTDHAQLVEIAGGKPDGAGLTCFGYGKDHNPELLKSMSQRGGGNFYYVRTPDECPAFFGRELGGLLSCIAQAVKVKVSTKPDVKILEVMNDLDVKSNADQTEAIVTVDDVYSTEKRRILLRLELSEMRQESCARPYRLAEVKAEFQDLLAKEPRSEEAVVKVEYVKESDADKTPDKEVAEQIVLIEAARAQEEAIRLANAGHFAQAKGVVQSAVLRCHSLGTKFANAVAQDLEVNAMHCLSSEREYKTSGGIYLFANKASYLRGRSTNKGSAELFDTKEQKLTSESFMETGPAAGPIPSGMPVRPTPAVPQPVAPASKAPFLSKRRKSR
jgi:Ca-activated chloride channel family protein